MTTDPLLPLMRWLAEAGLAALDEERLVAEFCERCRSAGVPLWRSMLGTDTLHPVIGGRGFEWRRGWQAVRHTEYARDGSEVDEKWLASPVYQSYQRRDICRVPLPSRGATGSP